MMPDGSGLRGAVVVGPQVALLMFFPEIFEFLPEGLRVFSHRQQEALSLVFVNEWASFRAGDVARELVPPVSSGAAHGILMPLVRKDILVYESVVVQRKKAVKLRAYGLNHTKLEGVFRLAPSYDSPETRKILKLGSDCWRSKKFKK